MRSQVDVFLTFTVMHINYLKLRGEQSNLDEKFVKDFCASHNLTFFEEGGRLKLSLICRIKRGCFNWFSGLHKTIELLQ